MSNKLNVTLLAGGVGGAKMAEGFAAIESVELTVIGNVADDDEFHGLWVSPDVDTVTYSLAGLINRDQGWGVSDEGLRALSVLKTLGADSWMTLGDKDFGLHIYRTQRRKAGDRPSDIARDVAKNFGVSAKIVLPTDERVRTRVRTQQGWLSFQEYFVRERCAPNVLELAYEGAETARATPEALSAIAEADLIVLAPSNPLVSIRPILEIPGLRPALEQAKAPVFAVSPIIAGRVVKGPADKMMSSLGFRADAYGVAEQYSDFLDLLFIDDADADLSANIATLGVATACTDIMMSNAAEKRRLAVEIITHFEPGKSERAA